MKKGIFLLFLIPTIMIYSQISMDEIKTQIEEMQKKSIESMKNNDYLSSLECYSDDAYSLPSYEPMMQGMEAFKKSGEEMAKSGIKWKDFTMETVDIMTGGNLVVEIGKYTLLMEMPGMPMEYPDKGKYVNVYEVQDDGKLKIKVETWNSDINPWDEMQKMMPPPPPPAPPK